MVPTPDSFQDLEACHGRLISWCDLLDAVADFLPCRIDEHFCRTVGRELLPLLATSQLIEEQVVCARLGQIMSETERTAALESRRAARQSQSRLAQEVVSALTELQDGRCALSWEAVSYLIRSFSGAMREQIRVEREMIGRLRAAPPKTAEVAAEQGAATAA